MTLSRFSNPILALLLATASNSLAQQQPDAAPQANITCDDLADYVSPNATATVNMTALTIMYLGEENEDGEYDRILIDKDMQSTWHVSSWIQAVDAESGNLDAANDTQAVLWLETGDTDMQRVGEVLNMCHDYVPWRNGSTGELAFSREVLERAADDKGDCRIMLGAACVNALRQRYWNEATAEWSIDGRCIATRTGVPDECEGVLMVEPTSLQPAPLNSTFSDRLEYWTGNSTSDSFPQNATGPICDGLNLNNSYGTKIPTTVDYDFALNFPTVNILTFFANVEGANSLTGRDLMAEVVCLKPERAQEGSRVPRSAEEVLDELFGKRDDDQQDGQQDNEQDNGEQGNGGQGDGEQDSGDQDDGGQDGGQEAQDEDSAAQRTFGIGGEAMLASVFGAVVAFALSL